METFEVVTGRATYRLQASAPIDAIFRVVAGGGVITIRSKFPYTIPASEWRVTQITHNDKEVVNNV